MSKQPVKIFIASSNEVKDARKESIVIVNQIGKSHAYLNLEINEWEYDIASGSNPGFSHIQAAINPLIEAADIIIFIFYSRLGKGTLEEFEFATVHNKKIFVYFKKGFEPDTDSEFEDFKKLKDFKKSLHDSVLYSDYTDLQAYELLLKDDLHLYFSLTYKPPINDSYAQPSEEVITLIRLLADKEEKIKVLEEQQGSISNAHIEQQLLEEKNEKQALQQQLNENAEFIAKQNKEKQELEQQLAPQIANNQLKQNALTAIQNNDYDQAISLLQQSALDDIKNVASTYFEMAKVYELKLEYKKAQEYFILAAKVNPHNFDILMKAGSIENTLGYADNAIAYYEAALKQPGTNDEDDENKAYLYNQLGLAYDSKGEYDKAITYYELALAIDKKYYGEEHPEIATDYNNLGGAYYYKGEYDKAITYYELALTIGKKYYGEEHLKIATYYNNLGLVYHNKGEYDKAIDYYNQALSIHKKYYGEEHPDIATNYNNLGEAYDSKGEYDKAITYYEQALAIDKKYHGEEHPDIATDYNNLGEAYRSKGEYDKAITYYELALAINKKYYGEEHPDIATNYNNLGEAYRGKGEYDKAITYCEQALAIDKKYHGEEHPDIATDYNNLGLAYDNKGEYDKAIAYFQQCLVILNKFLPPTHPYISMAEESLALAQAAANK